MSSGASLATSLVEQTIRLIASDRVRAHETLFKHRRPNTSPDFHREIINAFHSSHPRVVCEAFRGAAKSTLGEETVVIGGSLGEFRNALVIGASYDRACERLESIGHEFETNEDLLQIFGEQRSTIWATDRKLLKSGVIVQARGAGQSLRGVKYHDARPDFVLIDDLEDEESTRTPQARQEMLRWLYKTLLPALTADARVRFIGNRLDPEAVIVKVSVDPSWKALRFPAYVRDMETGVDKPAWPALFPMERLHAIKAEFVRQGLLEDFNQEYMCEADAPEAKLFKPEHFGTIVRPRVRTWQATWAMVDPARSVGKRSATTAIPIWSWIGARLVVWDCRIGHWLPDQIIDEMLKVDDEFHPVVMGVEEDALNQFILQPLRQAMVKRGQPVPIRAMSAKRFTQGRGKEDFIKSIQPFFAAGEVEFVKDMPELRQQFLAFPKGAIDGPNALAYALKMRPGAAIYEDFSEAHIVEDVKPVAATPLHLAINATQAYVTAVLLQFNGQRLDVIADYVDEGDPVQIAGAVVRRAQLDALGRQMVVVAPPSHFDQWRHVGLRASLSRVPIECNMGGDVLSGRSEIAALFRMSVRGMPAVQVSHKARWTLNAFAGGFCRGMTPGGQVQQAPDDNLYATLMAGLESFAALTRVSSGAAGADDGNMRRTTDGRLYRSAMVQRR